MKIKPLLIRAIYSFVEVVAVALVLLLVGSILLLAFGSVKSDKCVICGSQIKQQINPTTNNQEKAGN